MLNESNTLHFQRTLESHYVIILYNEQQQNTSMIDLSGSSCLIIIEIQETPEMS